jgi:nucleotide-binding universal stress UspA family protein
MTTSHRDYEPFELAENMEEDLGLFEAAALSRQMELDLGTVASILCVADGSHQDATVRQLGNQLAARLSAAVSEFAARGAADEIIAEAKNVDADIIVLPVPCGEDLARLQSRSLGSVADALLQSSHIPLLCVRDPLADAAVPLVFNSLLVPLSRADRPSMTAIAWALRLAGQKGSIVLLEWADQGALADAQSLMQGRQEGRSVQQAVIGRAVASRLGSLIGAVQRHAASQFLNVRVEFRAGNPVQETLALAESLGPALIIAARPADHVSAGYHFVEDLLLSTRRPVLIV